MNPMMLARLLGLSSPLGVAANVGSLYPLMKDDAASATSRHAHGEALRATLRDSFNADRQRQGIPPLQLGPPTQGSLLPPQAQPQVAPQAAPPLPPPVNIPSMPVAPASVMSQATPPQPQASPAYAQASPQASPQVPQGGGGFLDQLAGLFGPRRSPTGPDLIQKFISALHSAGPGVEAPDRNLPNGW